MNIVARLADVNVRPSPAALVLVGMALHVMIYGPSLAGSFTFDDRKIVVSDPEISGQAPLRGAFFRPYSVPGYYRPLTLLSLGLDVKLFGLSPAALRAENLVWAGVGVGLFAWLAVLLGASPVAAWSLLLLLSVHPVRSEAIVSVVGRSELLAFVFLTAALLAGRAAVPESRERHALLAGTSGLLLLLALLSKENAFVAPALLPAVLLVNRSRRTREILGPGFGRLIPITIAWGAAFTLALTLRRAGMGGWVTGSALVIGPFDNVLVRLAPHERLRAAVALLNVARDRLLWPKTLAADYGPVSFPYAELLNPGALFAGAATLLCGVLLGIALLKRRPLASLGLAWAGLTYLPFANLLFVTGTAFAERLLHMPAAGVTLAVVGLLPRERANRAIFAWIGGALLASVCFLAVKRIERRIPEWKDDRSLFAATVRDVPQNGRAWLNLAVIGLSDGDLNVVRGAISGALNADPALRATVEGLMIHAESIGRPDEAEAIREGVAALSPGRPRSAR